MDDAQGEKSEEGEPVLKWMTPGKWEAWWSLILIRRPPRVFVLSARIVRNAIALVFAFGASEVVKVNEASSSLTPTGLIHIDKSRGAQARYRKHVAARAEALAGWMPSSS